MGTLQEVDGSVEKSASFYIGPGSFAFTLDSSCRERITDGFPGYFKNEKKDKERKRKRISQQFTSTQLIPSGCRSLRKKISRAL